MASTPRRPALYRALRAFCLGCFFQLTGELEDGAELPVELTEHDRADRPTLYEYRPLIESFVNGYAARLGRREEAFAALAALRDEPASGIFARAHASERIGEDDALRRTILIPLLVQVAEGCGGLDWDDAAFDRAYVALERRLLGERRTYRAVTPLVGLTAGGPIELGADLCVRAVDLAELGSTWPDASELLPRDFGREVDRALVLELVRDLDARQPEVPDTPTIVGMVVSALRLATPGAIATGPSVLESLDGRSYGARPLPAVCAQSPQGEPTRLDRFRSRIAARLVERLQFPGVDADVLEALDRWELALFQQGPTRSEALRDALVTLLGGDEGGWAAAMRAAALVGETADERSQLVRALRALVDGDGPGGRGEDVVRRCLVEAVLHGAQDVLVQGLDDVLLGLRPRLIDRAAAAGR